MIPLLFHTAGAVLPGYELDTRIFPAVRGNVRLVSLFCRKAGDIGASPLILDVRKNGDTLFSKAVNKPRVLAGGLNKTDVTPSQDMSAEKRFSMISTLSVHVESAPTGCEDVSCVLWCELDAPGLMPLIFRSDAPALGVLDAAIMLGHAAELQQVVIYAESTGTTGDPLKIDIINPKTTASLIGTPAEFGLSGVSEHIDLYPGMPMPAGTVIQPVITSCPADAKGLSMVIWI